jgi:WD40 repeat protein
MHIGQIGQEQVLVTVDDCGQVRVNVGKAASWEKWVPFWQQIERKVPRSAWGIDTHASRHLLAISCNAHLVTIFHLGLGIEGWEWTTRTPPEIVLKGHINNIPCVAFDRRGELIASGSLDRTVQLWKCKDASLVRIIKTENRYSLQNISNKVSGQSALYIEEIFCIINVRQKVGCLSGHKVNGRTRASQQHKEG